MVSLPKGGIAGKENSFLDQQLSQKERKAEVKILATGQKNAWISWQHLSSTVKPIKGSQQKLHNHYQRSKLL